MTRAEQAALKAYPVHDGASPQWIKHHLSGGDCAVFIQGYQQAEKDTMVWVRHYILTHDTIDIIAMEDEFNESKQNG